MSIETEIASLTTAIRNLTDVLLASAAKALPTPTVTEFPSSMSEFANTLAPHVASVATTVSEPKKAVKKESTPCTHVLSVVGGVPVGVVPVVDLPSHAALVEGVKSLSATTNTPAPTPAPTVSEDDLRVQIVELARPNMGDAAFKAFLGGKLAELQGAPCSISGTGKLPKIDAAHLPTLLAAINKQLGK